MQDSVTIERSLLTAFGNGDRKASEQIYKSNHKIVKGWIIKNGGLEDEADDIFQESMVVLFEKSRMSDFELSCTVGTYLFSISRHLWLKKLRDQQRKPLKTHEDMGQLDGGSENFLDDLKIHMEREEHYENLQSALEQIGEPCRSLLKAFYNENKTMGAIALDFGYTNAENAKTQKYKCLMRLKKIFYAVR